MKNFNNTKAFYPKSIFTILFFLISIFSFELHAQKTQTKFTTAVRVSSVSTSWHNAEMWDCNCVPNIEQDVIIAGHTVVVSEDAQAKSISITNGEHDGILTVTDGRSVTVVNDLNLQTNIKTAMAAAVQTEGSGVITVGANVNLSRPESYDKAGKLQLALNANSTMSVGGDVNIDATGSSIEENNSEIRLTGNANLSILGSMNINSTGSTKGVEVELLSGVGSNPMLNVESSLNAFASAAGALKFDVQAQGVVSIGGAADFNVAGGNTDFQLLVGEAGTSASFNTGGKLAVTTVSDLESKIRVRGSSEINVIGDLDLKMEKTATKLSVDLGEFGGVSKLAVTGKFATLNTSTGELLTDVRGASTLDVQGDFELKGLEGTASTMTKVRVRSAAIATFQKNVRMLANSASTNIEFNVEENAETIVKENIEMQALANDRVKIAMKSAAKLMLAKNFVRPTLYGTLSMEPETQLVLNGAECGQEMPSSQLMPTGDKFEMSAIEVANTSSCAVKLEATPYKRSSVERIQLTEGLVCLNGQTLLVTDSDPEAINAENGCFIADESSNFESKLIWDLGETGVKYRYPLCNENMEPVDISITPTCTMGRTTVSTYDTETANAPNNRPLPDGYTNFDYQGEEMASHFIDRFYCVIPEYVHNACAEIELEYASVDLENNPDVREEDIQVHHLSEFGLSEGRGEKCVGQKARFTLSPGETGRFTLGSVALASLPVELTKFKAAKYGKDTKIEWTTATEISNDYFVVQRSINNGDWIDIARADGAGNSSEEINYMAYDRKPAKGVNYYRISQFDLNGAVSYSEVRTVNFQASANIQMRVSPNPVSAERAVINLQIEGLDVDDKISFILYNSFGQVIKTVTNLDPEDLQVNLEGVSAGMHYAKINASNAYQKTIPLMVQ